LLGLTLAEETLLRLVEVLAVELHGEDLHDLLIALQVREGYLTHEVDHLVDLVQYLVDGLALLLYLALENQVVVEALVERGLLVVVDLKQLPLDLEEALDVFRPALKVVDPGL